MREREVDFESRIQMEISILQKTRNISTTRTEKGAKEICKNIHVYLRKNQFSINVK